MSPSEIFTIQKEAVRINQRVYEIIILIQGRDLNRFHFVYDWSPSGVNVAWDQFYSGPYGLKEGRYFIPIDYLNMDDKTIKITEKARIEAIKLERERVNLEWQLAESKRLELLNEERDKKEFERLLKKFKNN